MDLGLDISVQLGIVPLSPVFGSLPLPLHAGIPGTATASIDISANVLGVSVVGTGWTTGTISASDQTTGASIVPTATTATTFTAVGTNNLSVGGGQITLVTPYVIRLRGIVTENRAGYAVLTLNLVVPEPGLVHLVGLAGATLLVWRGRGRKA